MKRVISNSAEKDFMQQVYYKKGTLELNTMFIEKCRILICVKNQRKAEKQKVELKKLMNQKINFQRRDLLFDLKTF